MFCYIAIFLNRSFCPYVPHFSAAAFAHALQTPGNEIFIEKKLLVVVVVVVMMMRILVVAMRKTIILLRTVHIV